jgi:hypothetical protein
MPTAEEIRVQISAQRAELEASQEDTRLAKRELEDAKERQILRRELEALVARTESQEKASRYLRNRAGDVDEDRDGDHLPGAGGAPEQFGSKKKKLLRSSQDIANCRYNVSTGEHEWKIEGISWLESTLKQNTKTMTTSTPFRVGKKELFQLNFRPDGGKVTAFTMLPFSHDRCATLSLNYLGVGKDITMRYRFFIQKQGQEFVPWGDGVEVCEQSAEHETLGLHGKVFGPDAVSIDSDETPKGIFGMTHEELLKSEYVHDDTLTAKIEIELRSAEMWERCNTTNALVAVPDPMLHSNLQALLEDGKFSDVLFVVEGERFKAHRSILAARSEVFDCQLRGSMREATEDEIVVEQCDPATFKALLLFLYTDSFEAIEELIKEAKAEGDPSGESSGGGSGSGGSSASTSATTASSSSATALVVSSVASFSASKRVSVLQSVLAVAHKYQVSRLRLWCEQQLCECINEERVCVLLTQAHLYDATQLERVCLDFIKARHAILVVTPQYGHLTSEWPEVMLKVNVALAGVELDKASAAFEAQQKAHGDGEGSRKRKRSAGAAADA